MRTLTSFSVPKHWFRLWCVRPGQIPRHHCDTATSSRQKVTDVSDSFKTQITSGPSFQDFVLRASMSLPEEHTEDHYLSEDVEMGRKGLDHPELHVELNVTLWDITNVCFWLVAVYFETYGCQMNVNDTEIAWSILQKKGYQRTTCLDQVQLTCVCVQV